MAHAHDTTKVQLKVMPTYFTVNRDYLCETKGYRVCMLRKCFSNIPIYNYLTILFIQILILLSVVLLVPNYQKVGMYCMLLLY